MLAGPISLGDGAAGGRGRFARTLFMPVFQHNLDKLEG